MDSERPLILGHRGVRGRLENTLPSFERALRYADGVEFDVRLTRDGKLVTHHDAGFYSNGTFYSLKNLTFVELRRLHPRGRIIPRVGDVFIRLNGAVFNADVKEVNAVEPLLREAERHGTLERTVFSSERPEIVESVLKACPDCRVGFSIVGYSSIIWVPRLNGIYSLHVPIDAVSYVGYGAFRSLLQTFRKRGLRIYLWNHGMDELHWVPKLLPLVDAVISDDPARLRKVFTV
ncbi:glycerophosphodiester phosphodiesterase [Thermococcus sp. 18S1]|uniref:glycerophosphodiester phosphodiesterase family protein n=1 Tax=Thermococcus sp. 18S1 TaxID=1638210 RepID=UPI00143C0573|nr:glycerophosphodiester phosphodiesterase family protein [Thermococcus sp. 18S1]NJE30737.1 glycerophosphodiester phosphodiesterase [Thermococcus sp. 18S1]